MQPVNEVTRLAVGSVVIAKRDTGVCAFGEAGVCYETYELDGRAGWSIIFQGGRYDGFSPVEAAAMLHVTGRQAANLYGYCFQNVRQLAKDYQAGKFAEAFALAGVAVRA